MASNRRRFTVYSAEELILAFSDKLAGYQPSQEGLNANEFVYPVLVTTNETKKTFRVTSKVKEEAPAETPEPEAPEVPVSVSPTKKGWSKRKKIMVICFSIFGVVALAGIITGIVFAVK